MDIRYCYICNPFIKSFRESITSLLVHFKEEVAGNDANGSVESLGM